MSCRHDHNLVSPELGDKRPCLKRCAWESARGIPPQTVPRSFSLNAMLAALLALSSLRSRSRLALRGTTPARWSGRPPGAPFSSSARGTRFRDYPVCRTSSPAGARHRRILCHYSWLDDGEVPIASSRPARCSEASLRFPRAPPVRDATQIRNTCRQARLARSQTAAEGAKELVVMRSPLTFLPGDEPLRSTALSRAIQVDRGRPSLRLNVSVSAYLYGVVPA